MTDAIRKLLIAQGREEFISSKKLISFSGHKSADAMLNDLERFPHAFLLGCLCDRQMKAERAWRVPYELKRRIGTFSFSALRKLSVKEIERHMQKPTSLHRFAKTMARNIHKALERIDTEYGGRADKIWNGRPSSAEVIYRFLQFDGVGVKIATMATNILARSMKVQFSDYYSIDISPDVHVRRVFARLGLVEERAPVEKLIYRARALSPEFPGLLDAPTFDIGRAWCRPRKRLCEQCTMGRICPSAVSERE